MRKSMRDLSRGALALLVMVTVLLLSVPALAATADTVELAENGTVTVISGHAAEEKLSSVQVRLSIAPAEGQSVGFTFSAGIADRLTRYSYADGTLSVYVAGTAPLLAEGQDRFVLGAITGGDLASAELPDDALQFVYGRRVVPQSAELTRTGAVPNETPTPAPEDTPEPAPTPESQIRLDLRTALDTAKGYDAAGYTPASFQALQAAIQSAEEVLANAEASEAEWTAAKQALQAAVDKLVPVASADGSGPVIGDGPDDGTGSGAPEPGPTVSETVPPVAPTAAPTASAAATDTPAATDGPEPTADQEATATPAPTASATPTPTATAAPTAAPGGASNAPGTGDEADAAFWLAALCLSGSLLALALRRLKRCK